MVAHRQYLLNRFLLGCIFIGVVMVLIKEKEGFATHYYHLDELYRSPLLEIKSQSQEPVNLIKAPKPKVNEEKIVKMKNYSKVGDNYAIHRVMIKVIIMKCVIIFINQMMLLLVPSRKHVNPDLDVAV